MKIGVVGGTFDPPHNGHLSIAESAMEQLGLDEVIFVPARQNPLKSSNPVASAMDRLEMVRLAIDAEPRFAVSDQEIRRGGNSFTIDTLNELHAVQTADYWLILGFDALVGLDGWKSYAKILHLARIACLYRGESDFTAEKFRVSDRILAVTDVIDAPRIAVSSTEIRLRIQEGKPWAHLVPPPVADYIRSHGLYA